MNEGPYSLDQATRIIGQIVNHASAYPQGTPQDVAVTLTDEQWNAVNAGLQLTMVSHFAVDAPNILPDFVIDQIHEATHIIGTTVSDVLNTIADNKEKEL